MSRFIPIELHHASRLLNHGPTVLITSFDEQSQRRNIMAAAWSMPVEFEPPRVAIVVDKSTWTRELIEHNGKFGIVIPGVAATNWTWAVGSVSGRDEDKFNCYGIPVVRGPVFGLPLVEEKCLAWMECRLLPATSAQEEYDTLFGEVVSAAADARVFVSLFRILCKYLFSEVAVQAVTELDNKAAHCHTPVPQWHRPFL
ncbi:flavin reductase [Escherichia coli KTE161]|uniref:flavin reductase family protein n=9 Tax=Enterobacteriaceae TaxID=543 RepID=UPI0002A46FF9|nr:flavin reductase [Escherichia coli KTE161]